MIKFNIVKSNASHAIIKLFGQNILTSVTSDAIRVTTLDGKIWQHGKSFVNNYLNGIFAEKL